jgi:hypothetical protein
VHIHGGASADLRLITAVWTMAACSTTASGAGAAIATLVVVIVAVPHTSTGHAIVAASLPFIHAV